MTQSLHSQSSSLNSIHQHRTVLDREFPGLVAALEKVITGNERCEDFTREVLNSLKNTASYANGLNSLSPSLREKVLEFINGAPPSSDHGKPEPAHTLDIKLSPLLDGDGEAIRIVTDSFTNWSGTVSNNPQGTYVPTTVVGVQNIVLHAAAHQKRVRVAGFRQTWSNLYSSDSQILVSLLPIATATGSSADVEASVNAPPTDFNQIEIQPRLAVTDPTKQVVRIGAGVSNEAFRIWAIENGWTLPANVIVVENTIGGVNAPICHGAGITHGPPNDRVRQIEYVDAHGVVQAVSDPTQLRAAGAAFGLLGVVTHITFELDKMTYATQQPVKLHAMLAVPPPAGWNVPDPLKGNFTPQELDAAWVDFTHKAAESYYCEWFWFAQQPEVWVNCWKNKTDSAGVEDYPDEKGTFLMWMENLGDAWLNAEPAFRSLPGTVQGSINGMINFNRSPPISSDDGVHTVHLPNAIHYRRGTQNFPILDTECEIPLPALASDPTKPDWSYAQRAWWDAITLAQNDATGAVRVGIEMRIIGPSTATLAPQQGSEFGFASIEIVTSLSSGEDGTWVPLVQSIIDKWTSYDVGGVPLVVRPHWAKMWEQYKVKGVDMATHLKTVAYKDQIPQFAATLAEIGKAQGWTLQDIQNRFSNPVLDAMIFQ